MVQLIQAISKNVAIQAVSGDVLPLNCSDVTAEALVDPVIYIYIEREREKREIFFFFFLTHKTQPK